MLTIEEFHIVTKNEALQEALRKIDKNTLGIVFVVDNQRLIGSVSDGDIRRALLKNKNLTDPVSDVMNQNPKFLSVTEMKEEKIRHLLDINLIHVIPIVNDGMVLAGIYFDRENIVTNFPSRESIVFIMAGGMGTRLDPFTKILPKPLIPFGDKPIIEHIMDNFVQYGFSNFILSLHYKGNIIKTYFNDTEKYQKIKYVEEVAPLGTAGSLKLLKDKKIGHPIIIANCDNIINLNFDDFMNYHTENKFDATILGLMKQFKIPYGVIQYSEGIYEKMSEKPSYELIINTGFYIVNPMLIDLIDENEKIDMPSLLDRAKEKGFKIGVYLTSSEWFDLGQWEEYRQTLEHFKRLGI